MSLQTYQVIQLDITFLDQLVQLEKSCFSQAWDKGQFLQAMQNPHFHLWGIAENATLQAYLCVQYIKSNISEKEEESNKEIEIINIATQSKERRKGYAKALLSYLIDFAQKEKVKFITLEVCEVNKAAFALYSSYSFKEVARRKKYYTTQEGKKDALIMQLMS